MSLPAYGLFEHGKLVATIRARSTGEAWEIFKKHHLDGQVVFRIS